MILPILVALIIGLGIGVVLMMMMKPADTDTPVSDNTIPLNTPQRINAWIETGLDNIFGFKYTRGSICNILHDPALTDMIPNGESVKCSELIAQLQTEIGKLDRIIDNMDPVEKNDVEQVQYVIYTELLALLEVLTVKYCSDGETVIQSTTIKTMINNVRDSVCDGFDIDPTTFKEYSERIVAQGLAAGENLMGLSSGIKLVASDQITPPSVIEEIN
jgi:hypothetical protein